MSETKIEQAARTLIGLVRVAEKEERQRSIGAELTLEIGLTGGGTETWEISIKRTASAH